MDPLARPEYATLLAWCGRDASVLDLGCGDGSLGGLLIAERGAAVKGVEIDPAGVEIARTRGLDARVDSIDEPLGWAGDDEFDLVIVNVTLQMVYRPRLVLEEALRVGRRVAVSFPNFGYWRNRRDLLISGRFPRSSLYGNSWYDTRHIHLFSLKDFLELAEDLGAHVLEAVHMGADSATPTRLANWAPNLFAAVNILLIEKSHPAKAAEASRRS
jgi:methionine biosynthesis protein MetW